MSKILIKFLSPYNRIFQMRKILENGESNILQLNAIISDLAN